MIDDSYYIKPDDVPTRLNAGGVVARRESGRWLIALVREGDYSDWVLPKGGVEKGETLEEAAIREVIEESGIHDLTLIAPLGVRGRLSHNRKRWIDTHYYLFITEQVTARPADRKRHPHPPDWFPLDRLPPAMYWPEQRELLESNRRRILDMLGRAIE